MDIMGWYYEGWAAVYEGVWLRSMDYGELEAKLYQLGYFPADLPENILPIKEPLSGLAYKFQPVIKTPGIQSSLANEISLARQRIQNFLKTSDIYEFDCIHPGYVLPMAGAETPESFRSRVEKLEKEYEIVIQRLDELTNEIRERLHIAPDDTDHVQYEETRGRPSRMKKVTDEIYADLSAKYGKDSKKKRAKGSAEATVSDEDLFDRYEELEVAEKIKDMEDMEREKINFLKKPPRTEIIFDLMTVGIPEERSMIKMSNIIRGINKRENVEGVFIRSAKICDAPRGRKKVQVVCVFEDEKYTFKTLEEFMIEVAGPFVQSFNIVRYKKL